MNLASPEIHGKHRQISAAFIKISGQTEDQRRFLWISILAAAGATGKLLVHQYG